MLMRVQVMNVGRLGVGRLGITLLLGDDGSDKVDKEGSVVGKVELLLPRLVLDSELLQLGCSNSVAPEDPSIRSALMLVMVDHRAGSPQLAPSSRGEQLRFRRAVLTASMDNSAPGMMALVMTLGIHGGTACGILVMGNGRLNDALGRFC